MNSSSSERRYFDWAATAPFHKEASIEGITGNPSSIHSEGKTARKILEDARLRCANVLGVKPETLYFTSGGTESNNIVLYSSLKRTGKGRVLYSEVEHPSIRDNCAVLERLGVPVGGIGVNKDGRVTEETLRRTLEKYTDARYAAIMAANNETGALMDMSGLAKVIRKKEPPVHLHCDLVQAIGKIPVDIPGWDLDSASISAHKIGGPAGIGLLYLRKPLEPLFTGAQERGIRPGTENIAGAVSLADALEKRALSAVVSMETALAEERWTFLLKQLKKITRCILIPEDRTECDPRFSPWILQARFRGVPGEVMLRALDSEGFAISTGSACSSAHRERPVLKAMGLDQNAILEGVRISQGWTTTMDDINALINGIEKVLGFL